MPRVKLSDLPDDCRDLYVAIESHSVTAPVQAAHERVVHVRLMADAIGRTSGWVRERLAMLDASGAIRRARIVPGVYEVDLLCAA